MTNDDEFALFDERKEDEMKAQIAAWKERDIRIKERNDKAMANMKNRMTKNEKDEQEEK